MGSNPIISTIWCVGRTGRVTSLSRWNLWVRSPHASPNGALAQKSRASACHAEGHGFKSRMRRHIIGE